MKVECTMPYKGKDEFPQLMLNAQGERCLVTKSMDEKKIYVTRLESNRYIETWESDLRDYKPLPKGTKIEIIN